MEKKKVLFLCTGNSCRSQMAEGFGREYANGLWEVYSAGTNPKGVHPLAVKVMAERGVDISHQYSKSMTIEEIEEMDLLVTLCGEARESCPLTPGSVERLHWPIQDPARAIGSNEEVLEAFIQVRDSIEKRVTSLFREYREKI